MDTTLSNLSKRIRGVMVASRAFNSNLNPSLFMCTFDPRLGSNSHAEYRLVSSPRPKRTIISVQRVWLVSACVVVRKVRGLVVTSS